MSPRTSGKKQGEGVSASTIGVREELRGRSAPLAVHSLHGATIEVSQGSHSLWFVVKRCGEAGFALRAGFILGNILQKVEAVDAHRTEFRLEYASADVRVSLEIPDSGTGLFRVRTWIRPKVDLALRYVPRDLYPIDDACDPAATSGETHTVQAGLSAPVVYLSMREPEGGSIFYYQNLTALNPYFEATGTAPAGTVAGDWPEFGYQIPVSVHRFLKKDQEILLSDAILIYSDEMPEDPRQMSAQFISFLSAVYHQIDCPKTEVHDWPGLAKKVVKDLGTAPTATICYWGCRYFRPYNDAEYPDCMVQLNLLHGLADYGKWRGRPVPLEKELWQGVHRFYDKELKTVRRYLSNVGADKNADEVDSWYLYHPLMSLARLARYGHEDACKLFFEALPTSIRFARKFKYRWPVLFNLITGKVTRQARREGEPGQSDVAGLYAYVMLVAHEFTGDRRYVEEAKKAIRAVADLHFELTYQLNLTAYGVPSCVRLWELTKDRFFLDQAQHFAACFFRHTLFWESKIEYAKHYPVFMGATCLDDAQYMAVFECHESLEAFAEALDRGQEHLPEPLRMLLAEYCKYTLTRAWYYHPAALPKEALATEVRNGSIDRKLAFPVEDLHADGKAAGQVGQEVYGAGVTFALVTHAYHRLEGVPFQLYCEYPIKEVGIGAGEVRLKVLGSKQGTCKLIPCFKGEPIAAMTVHVDGEQVHAKVTDKVSSYEVAGDSQVTIRWSC